MFKVPAGDITTGMMKANNLHAKKLVVVVTVVFNPGHRNMFLEAPDAVSLVNDSPADFPNSALDLSIVEEWTIEEDSP